MPKIYLFGRIKKEFAIFLSADAIPFMTRFLLRSHPPSIILSFPPAEKTKLPPKLEARQIFLMILKKYIIPEQQNIPSLSAIAPAIMLRY